jgi:stress response protein YsnF
MGPGYSSWLDLPLRTADGTVLGSITEVYAGVDDDAARWVEATTPAGRVVLLPADGLEQSESGFTTPYEAATLLAAPDIAADDRLSVDDEQALRRHYTEGGPPGDALDPQQDAVEVVRAEERLQVGTEVQPAGAVRLRKWVETRTVREHVVVHQERVRVEREPVRLTDAAGPFEGVEIGQAEYEVVLRDEQVVASKVTVPQEVVRLAKDVVAETVVVEADLAEEHLDVDTVGRADDLRDER